MYAVHFEKFTLIETTRSPTHRYFPSFLTVELKLHTAPEKRKTTNLVNPLVQATIAEMSEFNYPCSHKWKCFKRVRTCTLAQKQLPKMAGVTEVKRRLILRRRRPGAKVRKITGDRWFAIGYLLQAGPDGFSIQVLSSARTYRARRCCFWMVKFQRGELICRGNFVEFPE